jgi:hypothetical protein
VERAKYAIILKVKELYLSTTLTQQQNCLVFRIAVLPNPEIKQKQNSVNVFYSA